MVVKNGNHLGKQRYRCKGCRFQFTRTTAQGSLQVKKLLLYTWENISFESTPFKFCAEIRLVSGKNVSLEKKCPIFEAVNFYLKKKEQ